jgi:hypothetical protein
MQFDEPAFNVYMKDVNADWGLRALERAAEGLTCTTAVHICYGYGIKANIDWKKSLGEEWRQYEEIFPALAKSSIAGVARVHHSHVPMDLIRLLEGKDVLVGVIDVASDVVETPGEVADTIGRALQFVRASACTPCTNCGMAPMDRDDRGAQARGARAGRGAGAPALRLNAAPPSAGAGLGAHLGGDVVAVRHMQQFGDLAQHVLLVRADVRVGIGDLPHQLDHAQLLRLREARLISEVNWNSRWPAGLPRPARSAPPPRRPRARTCAHGGEHRLALGRRDRPSQRTTSTSSAAVAS